MILSASSSHSIWPLDLVFFLPGLLLSSGVVMLSVSPSTSMTAFSSALFSSDVPELVVAITSVSASYSSTLLEGGGRFVTVL